MKNFLKDFLGRFGHSNSKNTSDFSDFFTKPAAYKAKVIREVLREANEEQRKIVEEYRQTVTR